MESIREGVLLGKSRDRNPITLSLPKEQIAKIRETAKAEDLPVSRVASRAMALGLAQLAESKA